MGVADQAVHPVAGGARPEGVARVHVEGGEIVGTVGLVPEDDVGHPAHTICRQTESDGAHLGAGGDPDRPATARDGTHEEAGAGGRVVRDVDVGVVVHEGRRDGREGKELGGRDRGVSKREGVALHGVLDEAARAHLDGARHEDLGPRGCRARDRADGGRKSRSPRVGREHRTAEATGAPHVVDPASGGQNPDHLRVHADPARGLAREPGGRSRGSRDRNRGTAAPVDRVAPQSQGAGVRDEGDEAQPYPRQDREAAGPHGASRRCGDPLNVAGRGARDLRDLHVATGVRGAPARQVV